MAKADNLLAVLWLLRSRRSMTAAEIADALEISVRTVYRYIDALGASGVPLMADSGPEGGYRLAESFRGAPLFFEPAELTALFQAALFAQAAGYPFSGALERALVKVRRNLTHEQEALLTREMTALGVSAAVPGDPPEPWLKLLGEAVSTGVSVELRYRKPDTAAAELRLIDPYGLAFRSGFWYVVGLCHLRGGLREFRVDRVEGVTFTGDRFERPAGFQVRDRFADDWVREQVRGGPPTDVRLEGQDQVIDTVCAHWYLRHCLSERFPGAALFRVDPVGLRHLPGYLLTFGTSLRVAEPAHLREQVAELAQIWSEHHKDP